jgi:hypothetical protein
MRAGADEPPPASMLMKASQQVGPSAATAGSPARAPWPPPLHQPLGRPEPHLLQEGDDAGDVGSTTGTSAPGAEIVLGTGSTASLASSLSLSLAASILALAATTLAQKTAEAFAVASSHPRSHSRRRSLELQRLQLRPQGADRRFARFWPARRALRPTATAARRGATPAMVAALPRWRPRWRRTVRASPASC